MAVPKPLRRKLYIDYLGHREPCAIENLIMNKQSKWSCLRRMLPLSLISFCILVVLNKTIHLNSELSG